MEFHQPKLDVANNINNLGFHQKNGCCLGKASPSMCVFRRLTTHFFNGRQQPKILEMCCPSLDFLKQIPSIIFYKTHLSYSVYPPSNATFVWASLVTLKPAVPVESGLAGNLHRGRLSPAGRPYPAGAWKIT